MFSGYRFRMQRLLRERWHAGEVRGSRIAGAVTVITGAASGIGRATAVCFGRRGARLVLTDIDEPGLRQTVQMVAEAGGEVVLAEAVDITDYQAVADFAARVHADRDAVDIVLNIAGTSVWGTVENLRIDHWRRMVEVNLLGPIHIIERFLPNMVRAGRGGSLVNISSAAGLLALPWHSAYSASKYGLRGLSEVLRFELAPRGISVHLVVPGAVNTPLVQSFELVGVPREDPRVKRLTSRFTRHAVAPEAVAERIAQGLERNRFLIYTSFDIRFGYWWKRKFAWPYEMLMRQGNRVFGRLQRKVSPASE